MKKLLLSAAAALLVLPGAVADEIDGKKTLICANVDISECVPGGECEAVTAASINDSNLLNVDFRRKTVGGAGADATRPAAEIGSQETAGGKIYLQGVDTDAETGRGLAWTMVINQENGHMSMTASGDDVVFTVFGSCTPI